MKIRSLLLGSIAAVGLATTGYAADLGVVTSLDVCDELGLSGLTISSDDNCLVITGSVSVEYSHGDFYDIDDPNNIEGIATVSLTPIGPIVANPDTANNEGRPVVLFDRANAAVAAPGLAGRNVYRTIARDGALDSKLDIDAWLKFVATADSDFGPATATIKLLVEDYGGSADPNVVLDEAWVGIGDTTQLMAGRKSSIFNDGDDKELNYLGLFNSENVDAGVGFSGGAPTTGNNVIQVVSNLGNGITIGGGIENLQSTAAGANPVAVGTINYAGDGVTAHASGAISATSAWKVHAGFKGTWDPITVVGAFAADSGGYWNVLGSAAATFDIFTLAVSGEATSGSELGLGGSISAKVTDGVTVNLGGRYFRDLNDFDGAWQGEAGVSAAVTETITLTAAIGVLAGVESANGTGTAVVYGKGGLAWAPGGGFTASVNGEANTLGAYKGTFKAAKTIK
jgi:hypothetical protein